MDSKMIEKIEYLFYRYCDGSITGKEMDLLNSFMLEDESVQNRYLEFMKTELALNHCVEQNFQTDSNFQVILQDIQELAEYEKTAPAIENPKEANEPELIQKVVYAPRQKRKLSTFSKVFLAMNAAAILFFLLFLRFAPTEGGIEVATLTDCINAKWADVGISMEKGVRLYNSKSPLLLREGLVELTFDNNARVTIEGPAEFQILDDDMIKLNYGQMYSQVPPEAYGFQISTQHAKIIDLGTEFGIKEELDGDTEVHVVKGQVNLISSILDKKININLLAGSARELDANTGELKEVLCNDSLFARQIDSRSEIVWRGQNTLNLADIVGGGNGFGSGKLNTGINTSNGKMVSDLPTSIVQGGSAGYRTVGSNPFIDGVFVPGIEGGKSSITADNSISVEFPGTSGIYWGYIFNGAFHEGDNVPRHSLRLNGMFIGTADNPAISIHSNQGITFDLAKIRQNTPMGHITGFRSLIGISETVKHYVDEARTLDAETLSRTTFSTADFWVFLDGRKVYELEMSNPDEPVLLEIPVSDQDRYLTLAVTEADGGWAYDWALFGRPELVITPTE